MAFLKRCFCEFHIHGEASEIAIYLSCSFWVSSLPLYFPSSFCYWPQIGFKKIYLMVLDYYTHGGGFLGTGLG